MNLEEAKTTKSEAYDLIGLGFGPSNLALMAALEEDGEAIFGHPLRCLFLERKPGFRWHPDMLLEETQVQLSFLKDLVTLRNPKSHFTFLNYLKEKGRLDKFVNLRSFFPTRIEFNDYYCWVAGQLRKYVLFNTAVLSVSPVESEQDDGRVELVKVEASDLATHRPRSYLTRNLVVATGGIPALPDGIDLQPDQRAFHSNEFLTRIERDYTDRNAPYRFVVVGSGQSAAEIFRYLYTNYPNADVTAAIRRFAYKPADESHFVNEIFFPQMEDILYSLPEEKRLPILQAHRDTNYSCVDRELIEAIYRDVYQSMIAGTDRFRIRPFLELRGFEDSPSGSVLEFRDIVHEKTEYMEADGVALATGFIRPKMPLIIGNLSSYLHCESSGRYKVNRSYRIITDPSFEPRIFLQGFCEDSHGLSDTLLSTLPSRVSDILKDLHVDKNPVDVPAAESESVAAV